LAVVIYLASWFALGHGFYAGKGTSDAIFYHLYAANVRAGKLPYRDFAVEYPPGALVAFVAPTYVDGRGSLADYEKWFGRLMCLLGLCTLLVVATARPSPWGLALVAVSPLLIGTLAPERFDLWPTALTVLGVVALLRDRHLLGWAALGAAVATKLYPITLLPLAAVWTFRRGGRGTLVRCLAAGLGVAALIVCPFVVLAPHGLWASISSQVTRSIQIESLVASYLMAVGHPPIGFAGGMGSFAIHGYGNYAAATSVAQLAALAWIWIAFARGEATEGRFVRYAAASVCAFIAFGKVFSPQYLIWLVPLVALVRGSRGTLAAALLAGSFVLTNLWYGTPRFDAYANTGEYTWLVLTRNLVVVGLLVVLSLPRRSTPSEVAVVANA
jgi:uncharacterized membrane protein